MKKAFAAVAFSLVFALGAVVVDAKDGSGPGSSAGGGNNGGGTTGGTGNSQGVSSSGGAAGAGQGGGNGGHGGNTGNGGGNGGGSTSGVSAGGSSSGSNSGGNTAGSGNITSSGRGLGAAQAYTIDSFKACSDRYPGTTWLSRVSTDGSFTYYYSGVTFYSVVLKQCMQAKGFGFEANYQDLRGITFFPAPSDR